MATPLALTLFPGFCRHSSPQRGFHSVVNTGGVVKTLRRSNSLSRSVFSTAGSFGNGVFSGSLHSSASFSAGPKGFLTGGSNALQETWVNKKPTSPAGKVEFL